MHRLLHLQKHPKYYPFSAQPYGFSKYRNLHQIGVEQIPVGSFLQGHYNPKTSICPLRWNVYLTLNQSHTTKLVGNKLLIPGLIFAPCLHRPYRDALLEEAFLKYYTRKRIDDFLVFPHSKPSEFCFVPNPHDLETVGWKSTEKAVHELFPKTVNDTKKLISSESKKLLSRYPWLFLLPDFHLGHFFPEADNWGDVVSVNGQEINKLTESINTRDSYSPTFQGYDVFADLYVYLRSNQQLKQKRKPLREHTKKRFVRQLMRNEECSGKLSTTKPLENLLHYQMRRAQEAKTHKIQPWFIPMMDHSTFVTEEERARFSAEGKSLDFFLRRILSTDWIGEVFRMLGKFWNIHFTDTLCYPSPSLRIGERRDLYRLVYQHQNGSEEMFWKLQLQGYLVEHRKEKWKQQNRITILGSFKRLLSLQPELVKDGHKILALESFIYRSDP